MKIVNKNILLVFFLLLLLIQASAKSQLVYSGIEGRKITPVYSERSNPQWCWAACIQFVLNTKWIKLSQEKIIKHSFQTNDPYDSLPGWSESYKYIAANLNKWKPEYKKLNFTLGIKFFSTVPTPKLLKQQLDNHNPVILLYTDSTKNTHPVACTAVGFIPGYYGPVIKGLIIRDPLPDCNKNISSKSIKFPISILKQNIIAYWTIHIQKINN